MGHLYHSYVNLPEGIRALASVSCAGLRKRKRWPREPWSGERNWWRTKGDFLVSSFNCCFWVMNWNLSQWVISLATLATYRYNWHLLYRKPGILRSKRRASTWFFLVKAGIPGASATKQETFGAISHSFWDFGGVQYLKLQMWHGQKLGQCLHIERWSLIHQ